MKIIFADKSFLEVKKSVEPGKFTIIIQARDQFNSLKTITNSLDITEEEAQEIIKELNVK